MPEAPVVPPAERSPPVDYAVAVWLGTPKEELEKGLREGWIRRPGVELRARTDDREGVGIVAPPAPEEAIEPLPSEVMPVDPRTRIETLLRGLDPALEASIFADAWNEAGADEATRARRFVNFLGRALNVPQDDRADLSLCLDSLERAADATGSTARFVRLDGMTGRELEQLAATEGGVRRALAEHSPWAFTGDRTLARLGDVSGRYDRFDPDSGDVLLSDAWIGDRARHAAWRSAEAAGAPLEIAGDGWRFIDRAAGESVSVELEGTEDRPVHQVIFARDDGDRVNGGAATDRIHGGAGDDILRGRGGDDLLEGGAGADTLHGGSGRDVIAGQQDDDDLDGGAGADRLEGGSGDDDLSGGRGDDVLRGGAGVDTYRFEGGDGTDTIEDDSGVVIVDDVAIAGTMRRSGGGWTSPDGHLHFALEDEEGSGGTLVIREAGNRTEGSAQTTVRIAGWAPGSFGISLANGDDAHEVEDDGERDGAQERASEGFSPPPPPSEGGEGLGVGTESGNESASATATSAISSNGSWLLPDAFEALSLVDQQTVTRALDAWSPPAPPDIGAPVVTPVGVTSADIGDALAETTADADSDSGSGAVTLDSWSAPSPPRLGDGSPKSPPDLMLRTIS